MSRISTHITLIMAIILALILWYPMMILGYIGSLLIICRMSWLKHLIGASCADLGYLPPWYTYCMGAVVTVFLGAFVWLVYKLLYKTPPSSSRS